MFPWLHSLPFDPKRSNTGPNAAAVSASGTAEKNSVLRLRHDIMNWKPVFRTSPPAHDGLTDSAFAPGQPLSSRRGSTSMPLMSVSVGGHASAPVPRGNFPTMSGSVASVGSDGHGSIGALAGAAERAASASPIFHASIPMRDDRRLPIQRMTSANLVSRSPVTPSSCTPPSSAGFGIRSARLRPFDSRMRSLSPGSGSASLNDSQTDVTQKTNLSPVVSGSWGWTAPSIDGGATTRSEPAAAVVSNPFDHVGTKVGSSSVDPQIQESLEQGQALMFEMQNTRAHLEGQVDAVEAMKEFRPAGPALPQTTTPPIVVDELPTPSYTPGKLAAEIERQEKEMEAVARASAVASVVPLHPYVWELRNSVPLERLTHSREVDDGGALLVPESRVTVKAEKERISDEDTERRCAKDVTARRSSPKEDNKRNTIVDNETRCASSSSTGRWHPSALHSCSRPSDHGENTANIPAQKSNTYHMKKNVFAQYAEAKQKENPPLDVAAQHPQSSQNATFGDPPFDAVDGVESSILQQPRPHLTQRHSLSQHVTSRRSRGSLRREELEKSFLEADHAQALKKQEMEELLQRAINVEPRFAEGTQTGRVRNSDGDADTTGALRSSVPLEPIFEQDSDPDSDQKNTPWDAMQNDDRATESRKPKRPQCVSTHVASKDIQNMIETQTDTSLPMSLHRRTSSTDKSVLRPHAVNGTQGKREQSIAPLISTEHSVPTVLFVRENDDYPLEGGVEEFWNEVVLLRNEKRALLKQRESLMLRQRELAEENYKFMLKVEEQADRIESLEVGMARIQQYLRQLPGSSTKTLAQSTIASLVASSLAKQPHPGFEAAVSEKSIVLPFNRACLGANLFISADGYSLKRIKGCRKSIAMGMSKLEETDRGYWFQVSVDVHDPESGWVGGLGLGVTLRPETILNTTHDKAWKLPNTCMIGYWGRLFCYDKEHQTPWLPDELNNGDIVSFLITLNGEIAVFVNSQIAAYIDVGFPVGGKAPIYPVVDVFGSTRAITLIKNPGTPPKIPDDIVVEPLTDMKASEGPQSTHKRESLTV